MSQRFDDVKYRQFTIKTMLAVDVWKSRALRGTSVASPTFEADNGNAAVEMVTTYLDEQAAKERAARGPDGYPTAGEVRAALARIAITDGQQAMLDAHFAASDHTLTATQLAQAAGYSSYEAANSQYGNLARALAEELEWTPSERNADGSPVWTFALAVDADKEARATTEGRWTEQWRWMLRPQVIEALASS